MLGTFVEITARGRKVEVHEAMNEAFSTVADIHRLMSVHDPDSEISRINGAAAERPVTVSRETFAVLERAIWLARESRGAFDCTVAPTLARWGLLPPSLRRPHPGNWRSVRLLRNRRVRFQQPLALDLGGIAKGYAVDRAIEALRKRGVSAGLVNAGGDLRAFGPEPALIHLRHPARPQQPAMSLELINGAMATSSPCFTERRRHGKLISHLVNPKNGSAITGSISITIRARECWLADGLAKVVLNAPHHLAESLLTRCGAEAFVLTA